MKHRTVREREHKCVRGGRASCVPCRAPASALSRCAARRVCVRGPCAPCAAGRPPATRPRRLPPPLAPSPRAPPTRWWPWVHQCTSTNSDTVFEKLRVRDETRGAQRRFACRSPPWSGRCPPAGIAGSRSASRTPRAASLWSTIYMRELQTRHHNKNTDIQRGPTSLASSSSVSQMRGRVVSLLCSAETMFLKKAALWKTMRACFQGLLGVD